MLILHKKNSNQRYHFLTNFYNPEIIKKYKNKIEVHINKPGLKTLIKISNALSVPLKTLFDFKNN